MGFIKPASLITGNHLTQAEKNRLANLENEIVGDSDRLKEGLGGLYKHEIKQLRDIIAKNHYHILAIEAQKSSALGNIHISTLIELANELSLLKQYEKDYKGRTIIFVNGKPIANPAVKMRQDTLKSINAMKTELGMKAIDIVMLARQRAEMNDSDSLNKLFAEDKTEEIWEENK